jgi:hypothetical protein
VINGFDTFRKEQRDTSLRDSCSTAALLDFHGFSLSKNAYEMALATFEISWDRIGEDCCGFADLRRHVLGDLAIDVMSLFRDWGGEGLEGLRPLKDCHL